MSPKIKQTTLSQFFVGFNHEQSRMDRDSYVNINLDRVKNAYKGNFQQSSLRETWHHSTPYDFQSLMHYAKRAFRKKGVQGNTIENKFDPEMIVGGEQMSPIDIEELNKLYQCKRKKFVESESKSISFLIFQ